MKLNFLLYLTGLTFLLNSGADACRKSGTTSIQTNIERNDSGKFNQNYTNNPVKDSENPTHDHYKGVLDGQQPKIRRRMNRTTEICSLTAKFVQLTIMVSQYIFQFTK